MNILLLMAGAGSRFYGSSYDKPKPFIEIKGEPMYRHAVRSLGLSGNVIAVSRFDLEGDNYFVITTNKVLEGPVLSALLAKDYINNNEELIIMNSDQIVEWNVHEIDLARRADGALLLFKATEDRWSFAEIQGNKILRVAEKDPISDNALVGIHYWKRGKDFVKYAEEMVSRNDRVNGEFYIAPVYNYAIKDGKEITPIFVRTMTEVGTPESLDAYLRTMYN
jgi:dTDP-glucose pyrophosphorylase